MSDREHGSERPRNFEIGQGFNRLYFDIANGLAHRWVDALRMAQSFQEEAEIDPVSHVYTRVAFERRTRQALDDVYRRGPRREDDPNALAFLFFDIERFKAVNSGFTHVGGDTALALLGQAMYLSARKESDLRGRIGGDEFAAGLLVHDPENVAETVDAVRQRTRLTFNKLLENEPGVPDRIGLSIGVAVAYRDYPYKTYEQLCHEADKDMYRDKEARRASGEYGG